MIFSLFQLFFIDCSAAVLISAAPVMNYFYPSFLIEVILLLLVVIKIFTTAAIAFSLLTQAIYFYMQSNAVATFLIGILAIQRFDNLMNLVYNIE